MAKRKRNVNLYDVIEDWTKNWEPDCAFWGTTRPAFLQWQKKFRRHYRRCLGAWPERVALNLAVTRREVKPDHVREKILFDSSAGVTVPAYLLTPKGLGPREKRPGLLAAHGHGNGKNDIVGVTREKGSRKDIRLAKQLNYEYALEAVRRGYVVIAPDWCPFGERTPPDEWVRVPSRDVCNVTDLAWLYFGRPLLTQSIWDGMRAVDVLVGHPNVDRRRIGVIGLSQGGTMASHLLINDRRIRTGVVSGYISTIRGDALNMRGLANTCGAQHVPGLLQHGDIPDMLGLAVPKPILFEMGTAETCLHYPDMQRGYRHLRKIYQAAGAADRIAKDVYPGDHQWNGDSAWPWLERWLA